MAKIQLSITTKYLPKWGSWEGIRELVQNGRDAEIQHNAPLKVDWHNNTLRIENEGTTLEQRALLLGHTTKVGRSDTIGQFGEGLKLGVLALVRDNYKLKIRTGSEVWTPTIERSEQFDEDVLTFKIEGGREYQNRVRVEIAGIPNEVWLKMKDYFLFLSKPKKGEEIVTDSGSLLLGDKYRNSIYVRGIWVQQVPELGFGYNLKQADLDRDRKMVEFWNLRYHAKTILLEAVAKNESLLGPFSDLVDNMSTEVSGITDSYAASDVPANAVEFLAQKFAAKHGKDAVPVATLADSRDVEHYGKKGIVVSKPLGAILAKKFGEAPALMDGLKKEAVEFFSWHDLSSAEKTSMTDAIDLINRADESLKVSLDLIDVVTFRSPNLLGIYHPNGRISIAKRVLSDADETLATIIHEVSHRSGGDGDFSHIATVEGLWKKVVGVLRRRS